jgi:hypothetical protein
MKKNLITVLLIGITFLGLTLWNLLGEKATYSESERRVLAKFPEVSAETIMSGKFAGDFEEYAVDAFPMRDVWRRIKAYTRTGIFMQKDNHDIYVAEGHISKMEYPMNPNMMDHALEVFQKVQTRYLKDNKIYFSIIPDKNRYLAEKNGFLSLDYEAFTAYMKREMDFAKYIEISDLLDASDYYMTDSHWKQEEIVDVAERLAAEMGVEITKDFEKRQLEIPFYGVYYGQSALSHKADDITYLTNDVLERVTVEGANAVYDMDKAKGKDPYEVFLSGNQPIVTIRDEQNESGKRLIVFRDSFGSSLAPFFVEGYAKVTLLDARYLNENLIEKYVIFDKQDVLFLHSSSVINNETAFK